ncbi:MAG: hypothetical protein SGBAC_004430 [Bacillariaceae sp.]
MIDLTGYGSSDHNPSSRSNHDANEKSGKIRRSKGLNVQYLPALIVGLVLFAGYSMHSAKYRSGSVMKDVSNNHAFGMKLDDREQKRKEEQRLAEKVAALEKMVWYYQPRTGMFMETDPTALKMTRELQYWTQTLILLRYARGKPNTTFRVAMDLEFPSSIPDYDETKKTGRVVTEMAPVDLLPCSVFYFLEMARTFHKGSFIRNAAHVLQANVKSKVTKEMPFQEYSPQHPHAKGTTGYAGRPSGPQFYISILDNTKAHGPGSQQKANPNEADVNFGHVVEGMEDVVPRIHSVPQKEWLDKPNHIKITNMTILYKNDDEDAEEWKEWKEASSSSSSSTKSIVTAS